MSFHFAVRWARPADRVGHIPFDSPFAGFIPFEYGWMGVELFFVISGFVILMTLKQSKSVFEFACRRVARLWPALIVSAALTAFIVDLFGPADWKVGLLDYATSLILVDPSLLGTTGLRVRWVDGVYWTLWVELRFYFLAALIYFVRPRHFLKLWLVVQLAVAIAFFATPNHVLNLIAFPDYLPYFTLGICIFELWSGTRERLLACVGWALAAALILHDAAFAQHVFVNKDPLVATVANLLIMALFALFLGDSALLKLFASRPMVAIGQASYSLYLIHQKIGVTLLRHMTFLPFVIALPLVALLCILASLLIFRWVEVPSKRLIMGMLFGSRTNRDGGPAPVVTDPVVPGSGARTVFDRAG